LVIPSAVPT